MTTRLRPAPRVFSIRFSEPGLVVGFAFFALSLFPSLLPRAPLFQGVVSGITVMIGYGIGAAGHWLWLYLGIPTPEGRTRRIALAVVLGVVGILTLVVMWQYVGWQNDVRELFGMATVSPVVWIQVVPYTLAIAAVILIAARSIRRLFHLVAGWLAHLLPGKLPAVLGALLLVVLAWFLWTGVLTNGFFAAANAMFSTRDTATPAGVEQPASPLRSGSPDSVVQWESLGAKGRAFVAGGPTIEELDAFHGGGAIEPIRVYAGLKSAESLQDRADLVLQELIRTGAFERGVLVVATTTGTGFLEPNAVDSLEYVHNGDTAIAGVQYSYLPSWISLLADQEAVQETSQVVFDTVHSYWAALPDDSRPDLYLYGLSLGSFGVESILRSINIVNEPIDGAFMSGPPFVNVLHDEITDDRDPGSPEWLPVFQDGRTVRFTGEDDALGGPSAPWGPTRLVYLQHGSDPVVFFNQDLAVERPDWLIGERAPDVSDRMWWFPIVTLWQVAADLPAAGSIPDGFGHLYTAEANARSWIAMTEPEGWTASDTEALVEYLAPLE